MHFKATDETLGQPFLEVKCKTSGESVLTQQKSNLKCTIYNSVVRQSLQLFSTLVLW